MREIERVCGARLTPHGGFRPHARVRGSGHVSLHASGRAADMTGNPRCIYQMLANWQGGVSTDYWRIGHVHFDVRARRVRFAHWRPRHVMVARR